MCMKNQTCVGKRKRNKPTKKTKEKQRNSKRPRKKQIKPKYKEEEK